MRQMAIATLLLSFISGGALYAASLNKKTSSGPEQPLSCKSNVTRIGFTDKITNGQPFELWKCSDQWHLSNLGDYQIYTNDKGKPCIKNSSTGDEQCCPNANDGGQEKIAARFSCHTSDMKDDASAQPDQKDTLYIEPGGKAGTRSSTTYKISSINYEGSADGKGNGGMKKFKGLRVSVEAPGKTGNAQQDQGSIEVEDVAGGAAAPKTNQGGPGNTCNRDATRGGSYCQLPANILTHNYKLNKDTNGAVKDDPDKGNANQDAKFDGSGRKNTSEGGDGSASY